MPKDDEPDLTPEQAVAIAARTLLASTHAVEVFATARGGKPDLEAQIRRELADLLEDGLSEPEALMFHCASWQGAYNIDLTGGAGPTGGPVRAGGGPDDGRRTVRGPPARDAGAVHGRRVAPGPDAPPTPTTPPPPRRPRCASIRPGHRPHSSPTAW